MLETCTKRLSCILNGTSKGQYSINACFVKKAKFLLRFTGHILGCWQPGEQSIAQRLSLSVHWGPRSFQMLAVRRFSVSPAVSRSRGQFTEQGVGSICTGCGTTIRIRLSDSESKIFIDARSYQSPCYCKAWLKT